MRTDLLQPLQILTQLAVHAIRQDLRVLAVDNVALSVQEPARDLVLRRILNDGDDTLEFFGSEIAGAVRESCQPRRAVARDGRSKKD